MNGGSAYRPSGAPEGRGAGEGSALRGGGRVVRRRSGAAGRLLPPVHLAKGFPEELRGVAVVVEHRGDPQGYAVSEFVADGLDLGRFKQATEGDGGGMADVAIMVVQRPGERWDGPRVADLS